jgi:glycosyltransferase involved in cell wall biosynthesis
VKILFIGYVVPKEMADNLSGASVAGNNMQLSIIKNLESLGVEVHPISIYPIASFPKDVMISKKKSGVYLTKKTEVEFFDFLNISGIKQLSQTIAMYRACSKYLKKNNDAIILTFNMFSQVGIPAQLLKRKYGIKINTILADVPIDDKTNRKGISKILRYFFDKSTKRALLKCDRVIALNKHAQEAYAPQAECLIVDGGIELENFNEPEWEKYLEKKEKNIVYGGSLNEYSGILNLIKAFDFVEDENIVLDIYGDGYNRDLIEKSVSERIRYHGKVSNEEMTRIQRNAWILINPRAIDDEIALNTFPSKMFEYMMSGVPVISTRLNGFSEEYNGKIVFSDDSPEGLAKTINDISYMNNKELQAYSKRAYEFCRREKNWLRQCMKIYCFISRL